jgi:hypothetical protein
MEKEKKSAAIAVHSTRSRIAIETCLGRGAMHMYILQMMHFSHKFLPLLVPDGVARHAKRAGNGILIVFKTPEH